MPELDPFDRTRLRLTIYYAGVMGLILAMCGISYYHITKRQRLQALTQKVESSSGILHDSLSAVLQKPGQLNVTVEQLIPGLCKPMATCQALDRFSQRHILGLSTQDVYYAQLRDLSGESIAMLGLLAEQIPEETVLDGWQIFTSSDGERFIQYSLLVETVNHENWGYLQVGRSLEEMDQALAITRQFLLVGWPLAMFFICGAGWWLAGLALQPIRNVYLDIQQFTANVAHELRTPLSATKATVESVLEAESISENEARKTLKTINRQVNRLTQLVQDLLLLTLIDTQKKLQNNNKPCSLRVILNDVMDEFIALAQHTGVFLSMELETPQALIVQGDEEQLYRMIANLVVNAIQFTPKGGNIVIYLNGDQKQAWVKVCDTGVGIPTDQQSLVFNRFYRVHSDRNRKTGGTGLGLAIAQTIALKHQGKITIQSQLNQGSIFTVYLPIRTLE